MGLRKILENSLSVHTNIEENTSVKVLNDLNDVCINSPADEQILKYDADDELWKVAGGGHTIVSHSDTTATGAELEELTDGSETTLHSHVAGGIAIVDRGDASEFDFEKGDLTLDGNWHDMNLSAVVGEKAQLVLLRVLIQNATVQSAVEFRTKGYTGTFNQIKVYIPVSNVPTEQDRWVYTNVSGVIQYKATNNTWVAINILVREQLG